MLFKCFAKALFTPFSRGKTAFFGGYDIHQPGFVHFPTKRVWMSQIFRCRAATDAICVGFAACPNALRVGTVIADSST